MKSLICDGFLLLVRGDFWFMDFGEGYSHTQSSCHSCHHTFYFSFWFSLIFGREFMARIVAYINPPPCPKPSLFISSLSPLVSLTLERRRLTRGLEKYHVISSSSSFLLSLLEGVRVGSPLGAHLEGEELGAWGWGLQPWSWRRFFHPHKELRARQVIHHLGPLTLFSRCRESPTNLKWCMLIRLTNSYVTFLLKRR